LKIKKARSKRSLGHEAVIPLAGILRRRDGGDFSYFWLSLRKDPPVKKDGG